MDGLSQDLDTPAGSGLQPMSLAGTCSGLVIERGPKRGTKPRFCIHTCGAFVEGTGTLKPAAVRLPPAMEWGCVNWRGHGACTVRSKADAGQSAERGGEVADSGHTSGVST